MAWTTSFAFILRALLLFGIMVTGAVVLGALLMANKDLSAKQGGRCDCSLTVRVAQASGFWYLDCGSTGPCNFVVFTAAAFLTFGGVFCTAAIINMCRGTLEV
jgi:hypothetical protein